jgi:hypothetical protein
MPQKGDACGTDHHMSEQRKDGLPGTSELSAQHIKGDVTVPLDPESHSDKNQPDESPAGHLFGPAERCVEDIAEKNLCHRDNNRCQKKEDAT